MRRVEDIWCDLKPGDIVLKQKVDEKGSCDKTQLVIIVGIGIWDMAMVVYYTDYREFSMFPNDKPPNVYAFGEWMECWNVLGHWKAMPTFKRLLKAKRKEKICVTKK